MRSISDHLIKHLADLPGIGSISNRLEGDKQIVSIAGKDIAVSPFASDTEIEVALRLALHIPRKEQVPMTDQTNAPAEQGADPHPGGQPDYAATATPLPPAPQIVATDRPVRRPTPGSFVAGLRSMMDEAKAGIAKAQADGHDQVRRAVAKLDDAKEATTRVSSNIAQAIGDQADDILAELGQISNDI